MAEYKLMQDQIRDPVDPKRYSYACSDLRRLLRTFGFNEIDEAFITTKLLLRDSRSKLQLKDYQDAFKEECMQGLMTTLTKIGTAAELPDTTQAGSLTRESAKALTLYLISHGAADKRKAASVAIASILNFRFKHDGAAEDFQR